MKPWEERAVALADAQYARAEALSEKAQGLLGLCLADVGASIQANVERLVHLPAGERVAGLRMFVTDLKELLIGLEAELARDDS